MKKLAFVAAAALAGVCFASETGVTSANIVGYNTTTDLNPASATAQKYTLMGVPFTGVTEGKGLMLSDLNIANVKGSIAPGGADQVMIWVDTGDGKWGYETWYFNHKSAWVKLGASSITFESAHPDGLPAGTAYWFISAKNDTARAITTSGAVATEDYVDLSVRCGAMNFISAPYPVALKLNDSTMVSWENSKFSIAPGGADQIMLWIDKGSGNWNYETWYLFSDGTWRLLGASSTKFEDLHPNGVDVSKGFWYRAQAQAGKDTIMIRFKSPLTAAE